MTDTSIKATGAAMAAAAVGPVDRPYPDRRYAWFVLAMLIVAGLVSFVDRQLVAIVVDPMKKDLGVSDSEIGWLYGIFAVFYALAGLPIAYLADRYSRKHIIAAGIFFWSLATMLCGLSRNFWHVLLARIGVGIGEATLTPSTISLVGDYFPRQQIPLALSLFQTGAIMGSGLAFIIGGFVLGLVQDAEPLVFPFVGPLEPWQQTFVIVGAPGLLLALVFLALKEPVRRYPVPTASAAPRQAFKALVDFYSRHRWTFLFHHLGFLSLALMGYAFVFWTVSYFTRVHGLPPQQASQIFGAIFLVCGPLGAVWAAFQARWFAARGRGDANILAGMLGGGIAMVLILVIQLAPDPLVAFLLYVPAMFFVNAPFGLANGALPVITPPAMRAQIGAGYMFVVSVGMMLGPPVTGLFNEHIFPDTGGVRYSLMTVTLIFGILGLLLLGLGRRHYAESLREAEALERQPAP